MVHATGLGGLPRNWNHIVGTMDRIPLMLDPDWTLMFHAIAMAGTFTVVLPLGIIYIRIFNKVRLHIVNQTLAVFAVTLGLVAAVKVSALYIKSRSYGSAHQIIGILVCVFIYLQIILGAYHHQLVASSSNKNWLKFAHAWFGQLIVFLGIFNGALGLEFASARRGRVYFYISIVVTMTVLYIVLALWMMRRRRKEAVFMTPSARNFAEGQSGEAWEMQRQRREEERITQ